MSRCEFKDLHVCHCMSHNFVGTNFLTKLHNTRQHIQFVKFITGEATPPSPILPRFLTTMNATLEPYRQRQNVQQSLNNLSSQWSNIDLFVFEICSTKLYELNDHQVQTELAPDVPVAHTMTEDEIVADLMELKSLVDGRPIILVPHFRPHLYGRGEVIECRETIFKAIVRYCEISGDTFVDPSDLIKERGYTTVCSDLTHWNGNGLTWFGEILANAARKRFRFGRQTDLEDKIEGSE